MGEMHNGLRGMDAPDQPFNLITSIVSV